MRTTDSSNDLFGVFGAGTMEEIFQCLSEPEKFILSSKQSS